jgi:hypothetical protein
MFAIPSHPNPNMDDGLSGGLLAVGEVNGVESEVNINYTYVHFFCLNFATWHLKPAMLSRLSGGLLRFYVAEPPKIGSYGA